MASCNVKLKRPHFFQIILEDYPGKLQEKLRIPKEFIRVYGDEISSHVKVKDPSGKKWMLKWSESTDGEVWFRKGWPEFADYYSLKHGHLLLFVHKGNSRFSLVIFDKTATEIEYPTERTYENFQNDSREATENSDASVPSLPKKRKESSVEYDSRPTKLMSKNLAEHFIGLWHKRVGKNGCKRDSDSIAEVEVPYTDFKDFEEDLQEKCFEVGQVWAVYDPTDFMPRWYARISKVILQGKFKLKVTWLEATESVEWEPGTLSPCCGTFKQGTTDYLDRRMFSHLIFCENDDRRNTYKIFPREGETWAVFKNEMNEKSNASIDHSGYEFVEILSEYKEGVGVVVAYLSKMMGFVSVFCRVGKNRILIAEDDLFRFSHKVPSFKLIGNEKFRIPHGAFELDPGALTFPLSEIQEIYFCS